MKLITSTLLLIAALAAPHSMADDTRSRKLKPAPRHADASAAELDTLRGAELDSIKLRGYDKPLRATKETMLVSNNLTGTITALKLEITYNDLSGRMIHQRGVVCRAIIPPGATRLVKFTSWDSNHTFFYAKGPRPRTSATTPYEIKARVVYAIIDK